LLAALLVLHDGVLMPLAIGAGALIGRFVPVRTRAAVRVAAYLSLILVVVALPFVLGFGRRPDDPSALALNYGRGPRDRARRRLARHRRRPGRAPARAPPVSE
jgi:hypothetical protein